ncbi:MAG: hypothetical protein ABWY48_07865 [Pseudoxanthomonas sp.]
MDSWLDILIRIWTDMLARADGPMTFRFFLQPAMALLAATVDGIKDARAGRIFYLLRLVRGEKAERKAALREGVNATARILLLGVAMDVIYQFKVFGDFKYPVETINIVIVLALLPYVLLRGPAKLIADRFVKRTAGKPTSGKPTA